MIRDCGMSGCFAYGWDKGRCCRILEEPFIARKCPFYKTQEELEEGRGQAVMRLLQAERADLIRKYMQNEKKYSLSEE